MGFIGWKKHGVYRQEKLWGLYGSSKNPTKKTTSKKNQKNSTLSKETTLNEMERN
jgi:hypothetical protein